MKLNSWHRPIERCTSLALGFGALFAVAAAAAESPAPDTAGWKCTQCPFLQGYATEDEVGVLYASGANAATGRYSGISHGGTYVDAAASGQLRSADGSFANYDLERLGLAAREGTIEGGREGRYDLRVSYDGQPTRLYDTAVTPFRINSRSNLGLPAAWVAAGSTAGMSALGASLAPIDIGFDRRTVALLGRYFATPAWTIFGEFRRQEKSGTDLTSASFLTQAVQLAQPIDYVTDSFEAGAAWAGRKASLRLTYLGSWFEDNNSALDFANPYLPIVPGSITGRLGTPPGNRLQQFAATGNVQLPWFATTLNYAASFGTLRQDAAFLPLSTLSGATLPGSGNLDGNVRLSHYALGLASRPLPKLSVRGNAAYDGRNDRTAPLTVDYVATDTFSGGTALTPRYSEDRVRLDGGADYALARWVRIGIGGKFDDNHYAPGQVYRNTQNAESWGRATITPLASLSVTLKYGNALRKVSSFDAANLPIAENPLIRAYNYAPRDRVFGSLASSWVATPTLTVTAEGFIAKDDYRSSPLGLQGAHEQRASTTITWSPRETLSAYVDAGYQRLFYLQNGDAGTGNPPWFAADTERFWNVGAGGRFVPQERWILSLDYLLAPSYGAIDSTLGGLQQAFPQNWSKLDSTRLEVAYRWTTALQVHFRYARESYNSNDWGLDGVGPASVPDLLALGIAPYRGNANLFALTVRYQFGSPAAAPQSP